MPGQAKRHRRYHLLSRESLESLRDMEGDEEAEGVLEEREIVRDLATNPDSQYAEPQVRLAPRVWLKFKKDGSGRVCVWLELDESLTLEKIKIHWEEIREWQNFLRDWQGPGQFGIETFVNHLHLFHKQGFSYADIAELVANEALSWLQWLHSRKLKKFEAALARLDNWSDEETQHWASKCSAALQKFRLAGARDEELILLWWKDALRHLASNNKKPITAEMPITRDNIIDTLRSFRKRFKITKGVGKIG